MQWDILIKGGTVIDPGQKLNEVVEMSTTRPAKALCREDELGTLRPGCVADVVISRLDKGEFIYLDVLHEKRAGKHRIIPEVVIYSGKTYNGKRYEPKAMTHKETAPPGFIQGD